MISVEIQFLIECNERPDIELITFLKIETVIAIFIWKPKIKKRFVFHCYQMKKIMGPPLQSFDAGWELSAVWVSSGAVDVVTNIK